MLGNPDEKTTPELREDIRKVNFIYFNLLFVNICLSLLYNKGYKK